MEISPLISPTVKAADLPLHKLANNPNVSEQDKLSEASRQFEAVLLRQILSQAQKPLFGAPLCGGGSTAGIYQDMVTHELADQISRGGSFGFAQVLQQQLTFVHKKAEDPAAESIAPGGNQL